MRVGQGLVGLNFLASSRGQPPSSCELTLLSSGRADACGLLFAEGFIVRQWYGRCEKKSEAGALGMRWAWST